MEDKKSLLKVFAFEITGLDRAGIVFVAAETNLNAYLYLSEKSIFKNYNIKFDKIVEDLYYTRNIDNAKGKILYKNIIDL